MKPQKSPKSPASARHELSADEKVIMQDIMHSSNLTERELKDLFQKLKASFDSLQIQEARIKSIPDRRKLN